LNKVLYFHFTFFFFHTLDKGKADAKPGADAAWMQKLYFE